MAVEHHVKHNSDYYMYILLAVVAYSTLVDLQITPTFKMPGIVLTGCCVVIGYIYLLLHRDVKALQLEKEAMQTAPQTPKDIIDGYEFDNTLLPRK